MVIKIIRIVLLKKKCMVIKYGRHASTNKIMTYTSKHHLELIGFLYIKLDCMIS